MSKPQNSKCLLKNTQFVKLQLVEKYDNFCESNKILFFTVCLYGCYTTTQAAFSIKWFAHVGEDRHMIPFPGNRARAWFKKNTNLSDGSTCTVNCQMFTCGIANQLLVSVVV